MRLTFDLVPGDFAAKPRAIARFEGLTATAFRFDTGVAGLRIENDVGHVVLLPFQGQQVWDAVFHGRRLTMESVFAEPVAASDLLSSYGALLVHCGATAMGNPGPEDRHPLHGELPQAPFQTARLLAGTDGEGPYMGLSGLYRHQQAFSHHYVAEPELLLHCGSGILDLRMAIRNCRKSPMELMYLAHVNFRPVDGGRLVDTVPDDPRHIRIRKRLPGFFAPSADRDRLLARLEAEPARHRHMVPSERIEPELVMGLDFVADEEGLAHAMQVHPSGEADVVSHRPGELPRAVRWITRSADEDALGLVLPGTAEADGYTAEKRKGNLLTLAPDGQFTCHVRFGALMPLAAAEFAARIEAVRMRPTSP